MLSQSNKTKTLTPLRPPHPRPRTCRSGAPGTLRQRSHTLRHPQWCRASLRRRSSHAQQSVPEGFPKDILKTEVKKATAQLGISPENLIIYNYEVRKLGYVRQEILEELIRLKKSNSFDLVFIPSLHDIHQDHTTIAQEGLRAFKNTTLLGYELIWNNLTFNTQCFVELNREHIQAKVEALKAYESQGTRDYLSEEFIFSLAKTRGVQAGCPYAEDS